MIFMNRRFTVSSDVLWQFLLFLRVFLEKIFSRISFWCLYLRLFHGCHLGLVWRRNSCSDTGGKTTPAAPRLKTLIIIIALCLVPIFINAYHLKTTRTRIWWSMMNYDYDDNGKENLLKKSSTPWSRWESSCPGLKKAQNLSLEFHLCRAQSKGAFFYLWYCPLWQSSKVKSHYFSFAFFLYPLFALWCHLMFNQFDEKLLLADQ